MVKQGKFREVGTFHQSPQGKKAILGLGVRV
jgi:hypothetical protein